MVEGFVKTDENGYINLWQIKMANLWPDQEFYILFMTVTAGAVALNIIYQWLFLDGLTNNVDKVASSKNHTKTR